MDATFLPHTSSFCTHLHLLPPPYIPRWWSRFKSVCSCFGPLRTLGVPSTGISVGGCSENVQVSLLHHCCYSEVRNLPNCPNTSESARHSSSMLSSMWFGGAANWLLSTVLPLSVTSYEALCHIAFQCHFSTHQTFPVGRLSILVECGKNPQSFVCIRGGFEDGRGKKIRGPFKCNPFRTIEF